MIHDNQHSFFIVMPFFIWVIVIILVAFWYAKESYLCRFDDINDSHKTMMNKLDDDEEYTISRKELKKIRDTRSSLMTPEQNQLLSNLITKCKRNT